MKSILSKDFKYTPSAQTDIRKLFARIRREQKERVQPIRLDDKRKERSKG